MAAMYSPSVDDEISPNNEDYRSTAFLPPSELLPHLPSSADRTFPPQRTINRVPTSNGHPQKEPAKVQVDAQGRTLNLRSCVTCRKRKVKCDKTYPCSNCNKAHTECVFPAPGRAPRKVRKIGEGRDKELLERLQRLEGVVKGLGVDVPEKDAAAEGGGSGGQSIGGSLPTARVASLDGSVAAEPEQPWARSLHEAEAAERTKWVEDGQAGRFENRFGRLVVNEGRSRYINNSFWANLSNEVEDLKDILVQSSEDEEVLASPPISTNSGVGSNPQGWVFGFSSQGVDMLSLHPLRGQVQTYWDIYKDRVDPMVKVLHIPTMEPIVLDAAAHLANLPKGLEVLLFTIYYGATTSLSPEDCMIKLGEEKSVLIARYRFAIEQALARANFLTTEETIVLQAFVVFLICLRRNNDARVIWTLTGLVVRIAQTLGVHRDGSHFGLPPFEIEMRRRLWWQVCILDTRASEDHGCDPTIMEQSFDTKMPLNVNDADISPKMTDFPPERQGCTDISFCLIRFEVANTFRRLNYTPPGPPKGCIDYLSNVTLQDKERWITECHNRLEERYLKHCDMSVPLFWVTATVARLMMSKMWLMVYHPFQRQDGGASLPAETKEKLFITSLENIEYSLLIETEARTMKWGWLFKTYIQWHALAFILSELCHRTTGDLVERAWKAVELSKDGRWGTKFTEDSRALHLWRPLEKLYRKAQEARRTGLQEEARTKQRPLPPQRTYSPNPKPMFEHSQRPRITRAPLSQAQLTRFTSGPSFGEVPVDKHELFRSPGPSETSGGEDIDPMDATNLQNGAAMMQPAQNNYQMLPNSSFEPFSSNPPLATNMPPADPTYGTGFYANTNSNTFSGSLNTDYNQVPQQAYPSNGINQPARLNSLDGFGQEMGDFDSVMGTSGEMNWQDWDQLVKQFGMDVDSAPGMAAPTQWNSNGGGLDYSYGGGFFN